MPSNPQNKHIGLIGCGAIGSALARRVPQRSPGRAHVASLNDRDPVKAEALAETLSPRPEVLELPKLIAASDIVIEAASATVSAEIARAALKAGKDVLIMSVGGLIGAGDLFQTERSAGRLYIPSGAIGGLDAFRAIRHERIDEAVLKTSKPPKALAGAAYLKEKGIDLGRIETSTLIFSGSVPEAVQYFPQNINVAAAAALALGNIDRLRVEIYCDPKLRRNVHEISASGSFGRISFTAENVPSEDNPKTSQLAILSALATIEQMLGAVNIGS